MSTLRTVVDIPASDRAPSAARAVFAALLPVWDRDRRRGDAALVVSELVTNAYQHARDADSFALEVLRTETGVRIVLADGSSLKPVVEQIHHYRPKGRGMRIVETLALGWGTDEHHDGKRVWVEMA